MLVKVFIGDSRAFRISKCTVHCSELGRIVDYVIWIPFNLGTLWSQTQLEFGMVDLTCFDHYEISEEELAYVILKYA